MGHFSPSLLLVARPQCVPACRLGRMSPGRCGHRGRPRAACGGEGRVQKRWGRARLVGGWREKRATSLDLSTFELRLACAGGARLLLQPAAPSTSPATGPVPPTRHAAPPHLLAWSGLRTMLEKSWNASSCGGRGGARNKLLVCSSLSPFHARPPPPATRPATSACSRPCPKRSGRLRPRPGVQRILLPARLLAQPEAAAPAAQPAAALLVRDELLV